MYNACLIDIANREQPCIYVHTIVITDFDVICYWWLDNIAAIMNLIRLWYPLMHSDLYDIWFLGSWWLTRIVRDYIILVVCSQEASGEWVDIFTNAHNTHTRMHTHTHPHTRTQTKTHIHVHRQRHTHTHTQQY